jgi:hypothetical protein
MIWGVKTAERSPSRHDYWFAWHPVRLRDGRCAWFSQIYRSMEYDIAAPANGGWTYYETYYEYRAING